MILIFHSRSRCFGKEKADWTQNDWLFGMLASFFSANVNTGNSSLFVTLRCIVFTNSYSFVLNVICVNALWDRFGYNVYEESLVRPRLYLDAIRCFRSFAECSKLPYLDAVICESLRFSRSIGGVFTREVLKGGAEILPGDVVPSGSIIGVNNWVMGRNQDIYGADAEDFMPEQWLNEANRKKGI
jgi:hypothetical protein